MNPLTDRRRKEIASLARRKGRDELGQFVLEGVRAVDAALQAGAPLVDCVVDADRVAEPAIAGLLRRLGCPVYAVPGHVLARLADVEQPQGVLATCAIPPGADGPVPGAVPVLALDGVQDPGNVGTILRSAAWFGCRTVVAGGGTADVYGPKVVRSSMGALFDLDVRRAADLAAAVSAFRDEGRPVWIADLDGEPLARWSPGSGAVLVLGSEANGVSAGVSRAATGRVTIPGAVGVRGTESLNVSAAAAILLYAWLGGGAA